MQLFFVANSEEKTFADLKVYSALTYTLLRFFSPLFAYTSLCHRHS
jgi:hypothetical protein